MIGLEPDDFMFVAVSSDGRPVVVFEDPTEAGRWIDAMNARGYFGCNYLAVPLRKKS